MKNSVLFTRPEHDDTTHYLSKWCSKTIKIAERKGLNIVDLHRDRASRQNVEKVLEKKNPSLVILNGPGSADSVSGHKNEKLLIAGVNESLLKSKITYALSCQSSKVLGTKSIAAGGIAYIGYQDDFVFVYDKNFITKPLKDRTATLFFEPSDEVTISLLKGNTTAESSRRSKEMFEENILKVLSSETSKEDTTYVRYLWWNMKNQIVHGDKDAKIS